MSARLTGAVLYLDLPAHLKLVLAALADHADDDGSSCYPSRALLAVKASGGERKVRRDVARLEELGYLVREVNGAPDERIPIDRRPNSYQLNADRICRDAASRRESLRRGSGGTSTPPRGGTSASEREDTGGQSGGTSTPPKPPREQPPSEPSELSSAPPTPALVVAWWNEEMGDILPRAQSSIGTRGRHISARCRVAGRDELWWRSYFRRMRSFPFLLGDNDRGWKANIDFAVRSEDSVNKIIEGNYDQGAKRRNGKASVIDAWDDIHGRLDGAAGVGADQQAAVLGLSAGERNS